jgi:riboflavin kinase/FMN adenylyltransferase
LAKKEQAQVMKIWNSLAEIPADLASSAVTIGKFDGIHLGHRKLIAELCEAAATHAVESVVVTFDRHPDALLNPARLKLPLIGQAQKMALLAELGVGSVLSLTFDRDLAEQTAEEFVQQILVKSLNAKVVIVGKDFRFGAKGAGDLALLESLGHKYGFTVHCVDDAIADGEKVSTTRIRELLDEGNVAKAAKLLGRNHRTRGVIEHGLKIGRTIGFPTANMSRDAEGYLPLDGVYSGWLHTDAKRYPVALSVGINETFQAVPRLVEGYVLDETDLNLYDLVVDFEYVDFVRHTAKFDGVDDLVAAIHRDVQCVRVQLALS